MTSSEKSKEISDIISGAVILSNAKADITDDRSKILDDINSVIKNLENVDEYKRNPMNSGKWSKEYIEEQLEKLRERARKLAKDN